MSFARKRIEDVRMIGLLPPRHLARLDDRQIDIADGEILCFVGLRNEATLLPHILDHYRGLGVDRFFFLDNGRRTAPVN
ncbi:hypothetical protein AJ88_29925 [Mesorhizobium amorphae CCBAU 01583]|nr:hypothetical protein AJ88_29925 [Mesorhizobium amorphae CCBAU 01583]